MSTPIAWVTKEAVGQMSEKEDDVGMYDMRDRCPQVKKPMGGNDKTKRQ